MNFHGLRDINVGQHGIILDGFVRSPISASRFILRHCGVPYVRLIPQDSQALISDFLRSRPKCDFFYAFIILESIKKPIFLF
jgi:hypothetical protein